MAFGIAKRDCGIWRGHFRDDFLGGGLRCRERFRVQEIQKITDKYTKKVDELLKVKESEIMAI